MISEPPPHKQMDIDQVYDRIFKAADLLHKTQRAYRARIAKRRPAKNTNNQF